MVALCRDNRVTGGRCWGAACPLAAHSSNRFPSHRRSGNEKPTGGSRRATLPGKVEAKPCGLKFHLLAIPRCGPTGNAQGQEKEEGPGITWTVSTPKRSGNLQGESACFWFGPALCRHPWGSQLRCSSRGEGSDGTSESKAGGNL